LGSTPKEEKEKESPASRVLTKARIGKPAVSSIKASPTATATPRVRPAAVGEARWGTAAALPSSEKKVVKKEEGNKEGAKLVKKEEKQGEIVAAHSNAEPGQSTKGEAKSAPPDNSSTVDQPKEATELLDPPLQEPAAPQRSDGIAAESDKSQEATEQVANLPASFSTLSVTESLSPPPSDVPDMESDNGDDSREDGDQGPVTKPSSPTGSFQRSLAPSPSPIVVNNIPEVKIEPTEQVETEPLIVREIEEPKRFSEWGSREGAINVPPPSTSRSVSPAASSPNATTPIEKKVPMYVYFCPKQSVSEADENDTAGCVKVVQSLLRHLLQQQPWLHYPLCNPWNSRQASIRSHVFSAGGNPKRAIVFSVHLLKYL